MAKRRVRLNDENDPLSSTDKVLAGFEQVSKSNRQQGKKSTTQKADKSTSQEYELSTDEDAPEVVRLAASSNQEDKVQSLSSTKSLTNNRSKKSTSQQNSNLTSQEADQLTSQEDKVSTSQQDSNLTSQESDKLTSQENKVSTSQQSDQTTISQDSNLTSHKDSKSAKKQVDFSTSQKVKSKKSILRKSTFQINSEVLGQLDRLHLTLQLEMGKSNAPYKEVIVEEALVRLLEEVNSNRKALIEALLERHKSRDKI